VDEYQILDIRYQEAVGCWGNSDQRSGIEEVHHRGHREHRDKEERGREEEKSSLQREQRAAEDTEKRKANPRAERFLTPQTPFGMAGVCVLLRGKPKNPRATAARGAPEEKVKPRRDSSLRRLRSEWRVVGIGAREKASAGAGKMPALQGRGVGVSPLECGIWGDGRVEVGLGELTQDRGAV